jgi:hypothetical protein
VFVSFVALQNASKPRLFVHSGDFLATHPVLSIQGKYSLSPIIRYSNRANYKYERIQLDNTVVSESAKIVDLSSGSSRCGGVQSKA